MYLRKHNDAIAYLSSAVLVTLFLFCIDEGYYSLQWMTNIGTWIIFLIYASVFWLAQLGVRALLFKNLAFRMRRTLSFVLGISIGMIFLFLLFYQSVGK